MTDTISTHQVDGTQMETYLKSRRISMSILFAVILAVVISMLVFILYKQHAPEGQWSFLISIPLCIGAFSIGIKRRNDQLRKLVNTEFILTADGIVQKTSNRVDRNFRFSEIAVVKETKFGTTIVKGNWLTRIDYYLPKRSPYQMGDRNLIFIPTITTNYPELIGMIKQARQLA